MKPVVNKVIHRETCVTYEFKTKFFGEKIEIFSFPVRDFSFSVTCKKFGLPVAFLVWSLQKVPGVDSVFVNQYSIMVTMYNHFTWNSTIDKIIEEAVTLAWLAERKAARTKLEVKTYPNKLIREFCLGAQISKVYFDIFSRNLIPETRIDALGDAGKQIVTEVLTIPGVTSVSIKAYGLGVEIAQTFEWDDIQPAVISAISKQLGELSI